MSGAVLCDNCGKPHTDGHILSASVATKEVGRSEPGPNPEINDFCNYECLSKWAAARVQHGEE
jgi:hypothetical protein